MSEAMSDKYMDSPAFPCKEWIESESPTCRNPRLHQGMTLRDYFAAKAMQGYLAGFKTNGLSISPQMQDTIAEGMFSMADAMLKARQV